MVHSKIMKEHLLLGMGIYNNIYLKCQDLYKMSSYPRHILSFESIPAILVALTVIQLQIFVSELLILNFYQVYFFIHLPPGPK